jgi:hypothetical protein
MRLHLRGRLDVAPSAYRRTFRTTEPARRAARASSQAMGQP